MFRGSSTRIMAALLATLSLATILIRPNEAAVIHQLGVLEMEMRSDQAPETNKLLRAVLAVTTDFLYQAYSNTKDTSFRNIQCTIESFSLDGSKVSKNDDALPEEENNASPYSAQISIVGQVTFTDSTTWTQDNVTDFNTVAFSMADGTDSFFQSLMQYSTDDPFLSNITYAAVKVNGAIIDEDEIDGDANTDESDDPPLEVWMIALIGGLGAFVVVLCAVITCICCIPIDDNMDNKKSRHLGVHGTNPTRSDSKMDENMRFDDMESKAPSPGKSIGSQDSSIFTYNPKSVRSYDTGRRSYNSYFTYGTQGVEMDISHLPEYSNANHHQDSRPTHATTISANQISFGQDISAIEPKKGDLSLIEEDGETESSAAGSASVQSDLVSPMPSFRITLSPSNTYTNNSVAASRASGKYKSLLASMSSSGGKSTASSGGLSSSVIAQKYLTEAAIEDMEKQDRLDEFKTRVGTWKDDPSSNIMVTSPPSMRHVDSLPCRPSDEDTEDSTSYGPRFFDPNAPPQRRLNLGGSAEEVMNDLQELSTQIDQIRSQSSSVSGRTAIRMRR